MKLGELVKQYRTKNNLTMRDFAAICGVSHSYIAMIEEGKNSKTGMPITPGLLSLKKIALGMGITIDELISKSDDMPVKLSTSNVQTSLRPIASKRLPMLGNVACGEPIFADESRDTYIDADSNIDADFCLTAKGDSMINARIFDGDILFVKSQSTVEDGEIAVVLIEDEATVKRVYYNKQDNILTLIPENPTYKPMRFHGEQLNNIRILGKIVFGQYKI